MDFLELPAVARGNPELLVGSDALDTTLRWFHISDLEHAARLVRGGEVLLSTGFGLPDTWSGIRRYIDSLASADVRALCITAGGLRYREVPPPMIEAAQERGLPLIRFRTKVRFVEISEQFATSYFDQRVGHIETEARERALFSELLANGASVQRLTEEAGLITGGMVLFETPGRRVVAAHGPANDLEWILTEWLSRSVALGSKRDSEIVTDTEGVWVLAGAWIADKPLGRVIAHTDRAAATEDLSRVVKRTAEATALAVALVGGVGALASSATRELIDAVVTGRLTSFGVLLARLSALGNDLNIHDTRALLPISLVLDTQRPESESGASELAERLSQVPRQGFGLAALAPLGPGEIVLLVGADHGADIESMEVMVERWVARALSFTSDDTAVSVGFGLPAASVGELRRSMTLASSASRARSVRIEQASTELDDKLAVALNGLAKDPTMQDLVEETLRPVARLPPKKRQAAFSLLEAYARNDGNKLKTAASLGCSRATVYSRLADLQRLLSIDLENGNDRFTLDLVCRTVGWNPTQPQQRIP